MSVPPHEFPHSSLQPFGPDARGLERISRSLEVVETILGELFERRLPALEEKLDDMRALLSSHRKDNYLVEEVAAMTGRSEYTVRRWVAENKLKAIRIAEGGPRGRLLVPRTELERLVAAGKGAHVPEVAFGGGR